MGVQFQVMYNLEAGAENISFTITSSWATVRIILLCWTLIASWLYLCTAETWWHSTSGYMKKCTACVCLCLCVLCSCVWLGCSSEMRDTTQTLTEHDRFWVMRVCDCFLYCKRVFIISAQPTPHKEVLSFYPCSMIIKFMLIRVHHGVCACVCLRVRGDVDR